MNFKAWLISMQIPVIAMALSSCCINHDSRVAPGYPYGDVHELNFQEFQTCWSSNNPDRIKELSRHFDPYNKKLIPDKRTCDSLMNLVNPNCNCPDIDYDKIRWLFSLAAYMVPVLNLTQESSLTIRQEPLLLN
jgi:hypothetical protein